LTAAFRYDPGVREGNCEGCGGAFPLRDLIAIRGKPHCEPCANRIAEGTPLTEDDVAPVFDPTICVNCGADAGDVAHPLLAERPCCPPCQERMRRYPYPGWLKIAAVGLLVAVVYALVDGARFFPAAAAVVKGERLLDEGEAEQAVELLDIALEAAPKSKKATLLMIKALLLAGDPYRASRFMEKYGDRRSDASEVAEINAINDRVRRAHEKLDEAMRLDEEEQSEQALAAARAAARIYPEGGYIQNTINALQASVAFDRGEYERYLAWAETYARENPTHPIALAAHASGLACLYARDGKVEAKVEAESILKRAAELARGDEDMEAALREYAERIRHRIKTGEIISRKEYNRRFRKGEKAEPK